MSRQNTRVQNMLALFTPLYIHGIGLDLLRDTLIL